MMMMVMVIIIIIIIIIINCNWVVTRWQWLIYMCTKYELTTFEIGYYTYHYHLLLQTELHSI